MSEDLLQLVSRLEDPWSVAAPAALAEAVTLPPDSPVALPTPCPAVAAEHIVNPERGGIGGPFVEREAVNKRASAPDR